MNIKYTLVKHFWISCAHSVLGAGKCERTHGHNYKITFCIEGNKLNDKGMLIDFRDIKHHIEKKYDHQFLNDFEEFNINTGGVSPSTEYFAEIIFRNITDICATHINSPTVKWVEVQETNEAYAKYELTQ